jgi:hypothetical protein
MLSNKVRLTELQVALDRESSYPMDDAPHVGGDPYGGHLYGRYSEEDKSAREARDTP